MGSRLDNPWPAEGRPARQPGPASGDSFRPRRISGRHGAVWALGFMPLATVGVQFGLNYILARQMVSRPHSSQALSPFLGFASGWEFALVGFVIWFGGLLILYNGTQDVSLTVGYLVVRWIESYLLNFVLAGSLLTSIGLSNLTRITRA